ncbi:5-oxoprolinase subunit PxpB [Paenibacillus hexagrammi]|uniref:5-oxoprolinase subunit PxpB n=1 Tax=Paenibacillus hexagrammi TaxID=2908839 RepID=A0ABY3SLS4_9BACL|nr:5-oxoprolinase subunit PxpB [Paenibacillus sp. YPD9-1]UJF34438.1 5-oxoprolinase subunit PxpB [Paenibacillus sp. YPD9-1]
MKSAETNLSNSSFPYEIYDLGESAVVIRLGNEIRQDIHERVRGLAAYLEGLNIPGFIELVMAYTTITIYYDMWTVYKRTFPQLPVSQEEGGQLELQNESELPFDTMSHYLRRAIDLYIRDSGQTKSAKQAPKVVEIPVCYGDERGPDLEEVAHYHKLAVEEIIEIHTAKIYTVYMIGFAPGFAYLGGLDERIATPRRSIPRTQLPMGAVGIGGSQTGVYPLQTPGGWNWIGQTPIRLFRPESSPPSLLQAGDEVRFVPISSKEYEELKGGQRTDESGNP